MSNEISFSAKELEDFMNALNTWGKSLPKGQQALLEHIVLRSREAGGALSDDQLKKVSGGMFSVGGAFLKPGGLRAGGFWTQWSARKY